jgi:catechol 2,3-dioxygenase-like lactoylglutathione lyase family enzyme
MTEGMRTIIYPVKDIASARTLYSELLGVEPSMDGPYYVDDIRKSFDALPGAGAQVLQEVNDVGGGKLIASVKDADGNGIGLIQPAS